MADPISFSEIPSSIRKPGIHFEFNTKMANHNLPANRQSMLIIGQRTSSGSVAELVPTAIFSDVEAAEKAGYGSQVHLMARAAILANAYLDLSFCAIDDAAAGVAAAWTVTFSVAAAASGSLRLWVGFQYVDITINKDDAVGDMATALETAIGDKPSLPVTASANLGVVTLTAKNDGTQANYIDLAYEVTNACTTAAIAQTVQGATDPDITEVTAEIFTGSYDIIATSLMDTTNLQALRDHLDSVSGPMEQRSCIAWYGYDGVLASATTLASDQNAGRLYGAYLRGTKSIPFEIAAACAAVDAAEEDPAMPLDDTYLPGIHAPAIADRLSRTEQESCLWNGVTPLYVGPGEKVQIVRAISTYTVNAQSIPDPALLDRYVIKSLDYGRTVMIAEAAKFKPGKATARVLKALRSAMIDAAKKLEAAEIWENVDDLKDQFVVQKDDQEAGRVNAVIPADVVNGLHVFAGRIDLIL